MQPVIRMRVGVRQSSKLFESRSIRIRYDVSLEMDPSAKACADLKRLILLNFDLNQSTTHRPYLPLREMVNQIFYIIEILVQFLYY